MSEVEASAKQASLADREARIDEALRRAEKSLLGLRHEDGYWCFELEADCTITAEYIMMMHFRGEVDGWLEKKIVGYLRQHQNEEGGWPLFFGGPSEISCSVKCYFALKLAGEDPELLHMAKARQLILAMGGAARSNVFTRIALALFEQLPWRGVPFIPVEIMLLPRWFPFHLSKVSYWSRTVMVPLFVLYSLKPKAANPRRVSIAELFTIPPYQEQDYFPVRSLLNKVILRIERLGRRLAPLIPGIVRRRAMRSAEAWLTERLNGVDGLGAIFPAMVNAWEALELLGYDAKSPHCRSAREALERLLVDRGEEAYCQPCVSPVWDTALACLALQYMDSPASRQAVKRGLDWILPRQLLEGPADWRESRPRLRPGGWPFQFGNGHYPDLDDTAAVAYAMVLSGDPAYQESIERAAEWLAGMQSRNGGFGAFDADCTCYYLNEIPFADHGALLDPPTSDVSARVLMFLSSLGEHRPEYEDTIESCIRFVLGEDEGGCWFGRWGTNYIYGTWSVLMALRAARFPSDHPCVRAAVLWLEGKQRSDGGWAESNETYSHPESRGEGKSSTAFQTAWALIGLMEAGALDSPSVEAGIEFLLRRQEAGGLWADPDFTAPGFPRVFYLKYHGYDKYFPLWAIAQYRKLKLEQGA